MARETRRMALYEAIRKGQSKRRGREKTVRFRPFASARSRMARKKKDIAFYQRFEAGSDSGKTKAAALWSRRINLSLSYPVVGLLVVAVAVVLIAAIRFGQFNYDAGWLFFEPVAVSENDSGELNNIRNLIDSTAADAVNDNETRSTDNEIVQNDKNQETKVIVPQGNNVIVIQGFKLRRDLEPVQEHFESNGIKTEIVEGDRYFLLRTKQLYQRFSINRDNFNPDNDGDVAMKEIHKVGKTYKAPPGYDSFGTNLFRDAYPMKIK